MAKVTHGKTHYEILMFKVLQLRRAFHKKSGRCEDVSLHVRLLCGKRVLFRMPVLFFIPYPFDGKSWVVLVD